MQGHRLRKEKKMFKKSLIAIAMLAMAFPAFAGSVKIHDPWPTQYVPQEITTIDVTLDVGFFIHIIRREPYIYTERRCHHHHKQTTRISYSLLMFVAIYPRPAP